MESIFSYLDYHKYLKDYYDMKKQKNHFFSYRYMGQKIELDAGFLVKIMQGKGHLSQKAIPRVLSFFKFTPREADYFEAMVQFARAKSEKDVKRYFDLMLQLRGVEASCTEERQYSFYSKWYHTAIRSLLEFYPFHGDFKALAAKLSPNISEEEARDSIALLEELDFIRRDEDGLYALTDTIITTGSSWRSKAIRNFQRESIQLSMESLERHDKSIRDISTVTIGVNHNDLKRMSELAKDFRQAVLQMKTDNKDSDAVYQINIQITPLTEVEGL